MKKQIDFQVGDPVTLIANCCSIFKIGSRGTIEYIESMECMSVNFQEEESIQWCCSNCLAPFVAEIENEV
jgi:hypothetical protein